MGKIHLFTPEQEIILNQIEKDSYLKSNFYFTGGTALSYLYLQHRHSEDLDFFSTNKLDEEKIFSTVTKWSKAYNFSFEPQMKEVVYIFLLSFNNGVQLKVDFGYYPYPRVEQGTLYKNLDVDSLLDIAINKFVTIHQRASVKDFIDLYFLLKEFTIWDIMYGAEKKFHMKNDPFILSANILDKIEEFDYLPKMIKPLSLEELKSFFRQKAKEIGSRAVE